MLIAPSAPPTALALFGPGCHVRDFLGHREAALPSDSRRRTNPRGSQVVVAAALVGLPVAFEGGPADPGPTPHSVAVVPPVTWASTNTKFKLIALGRDASGSPLAYPPAVSWTGTGITFTDPTNATTLVTVGTSDVLDIRVTMGGVTSAPAKVIVGGDGTSSASDRFETMVSGDGLTAAVLLDANVATTGTDCTNGNDLFYPLVGVAVLGKNLRPGCINKIAVFVPGHAVLFECDKIMGGPTCGADLKSIWTDSRDQVARQTLPVPVPVGLVVWYRADAAATDLPFRVTTDVTYATTIYGARRAGMTFNIRDGAGGGANDGVVRTLTGECDSVEKQLGFTSVPDVINVVLAERIYETQRGKTCFLGDKRLPIIVLSRSNNAPSTLAHELAHTMALSSYEFPDDPWGHTDDVAGFDETSLMLPRENGTAGLERDYLSLGQAFRMHADWRSWINRAKLRTGDTEQCQPKRESNQPCPRLALDLEDR